MTLEEKEKIIVDNYGLMEQLKYWFTEIAELTIAITKYQCGAGTIEEVKDEIGDVDMMLNQFRVALEILKKDIEDIKEFKADRQLKRIELEKKKV